MIQYNYADIVIGKPPASTTSISQPLDVEKAFIGATTINRGIKTASERSAFMEITVTDRIKAMIKDHESNIAHPFNSSHKGLLDVGLQQVRHILVNNIKRRTISESFHMTGQWNKVKGGCDLETILGTCVAKFTVNEVSKLFECLPILKGKMIAQVELFENDYECLGYSNINMEGSSRDNLVLNRRRFVFLTNSALILREEEK